MLRAYLLCISAIASICMPKLGKISTTLPRFGELRPQTGADSLFSTGGFEKRDTTHGEKVRDSEMCPPYKILPQYREFLSEIIEETKYSPSTVVASASLTPSRTVLVRRAGRSLTGMHKPFPPPLAPCRRHPTRFVSLFCRDSSANPSSAGAVSLPNSQPASPSLRWGKV